jgi:hypothetical protein
MPQYVLAVALAPTSGVPGSAAGIGPEMEPFGVAVTSPRIGPEREPFG